MKKKKKEMLLKLILFVLTLTLLFLFAFKTSFFNINNIKVVGNKKMNYDKVIKASMCIKGENIFKINKKEGEKSLSSLPYIKEAKIKRKLPKKIIIEIVEREEMAVVPYIGSILYIDEEGYILSMEEIKKEIELPKITGLDIGDLEVGGNLFDQIGKDKTTDFIVSSNRMKLLPLMKHINLSDSNNITIELKDGIKVAFGPLDNVKYKLSFLYKILDDVDKKDIIVKQIFLNKGDNPVIVSDNN